MTHIFISDASPLIGFERLNRPDILQQLVQSLYIPTAVRIEVFGERPLPKRIIERPILQPLSAVTLSPRLGPGECEAIVLALELEECLLFLDDLLARRTAQSLGIRVVGTAGLLVRAKQQHYITAIKPYLDQLRAADFRISGFATGQKICSGLH